MSGSLPFLKHGQEKHSYGDSQTESFIRLDRPTDILALPPLLHVIRAPAKKACGAYSWSCACYAACGHGRASSSSTMSRTECAQLLRPETCRPRKRSGFALLAQQLSLAQGRQQNEKVQSHNS